MFPAESAKFITENAKYVKINEGKLEELCTKILQDFDLQNRNLQTWSSHALHPKEKNEKSLHWILLVDLLNFSFWSEDGDGHQYCVTFDNVKYTGYYSLCAAINRALQEGIDITNPQFFGQITLNEIREIFRGDDPDVPIPLLEHRLNCMHEIGQDLCKNYGGSFVTLVEQCKGSARELLLKLSKYHTFKDEAIFHNQQVSFYKKAQILIGDLWCCFNGESWGQFHDIDTITAFADYRVPQALCYFEVLTYSDELNETLTRGNLLPNGHPMEVELRGCTLWAIELMAKQIRETSSHLSGKSINSILLDHYLWDYRREHAQKISRIPFHRTRCIYY